MLCHDTRARVYDGVNPGTDEYSRIYSNEGRSTFVLKSSNVAGVTRAACGKASYRMTAAAGPGHLNGLTLVLDGISVSRTR
ncbi:unnamed protein product [Jaminaea pallidilutea]